MRRVAVAASGGRDSTALLHCTLRAAAPLGLEVVALHVHHGLVAAADEWRDQVRRQARRWGAGFACRRLDTAPGPGDSVEAWARRERYSALAEMAREAGCGIVLLAHHRRDQAETWLLQALRSGGPRGLSAMPRGAEREGVVWARPWLDQPREAVEAYVRRHRLQFFDDGSNADMRFARNRLRLQVWPVLTAAFLDAEVALAGAAARAQEAAALADEVAALDLPPLRHGAALDVASWRTLPPARRRNALRAWLGQTLRGPVPQSLLQRLCAELPRARAASWPAPEGAMLRLHCGWLGQALASERAAEASAAHPAKSGPIDIGTPGLFDCPAWQGHFVVEAVARGGVAATQLRAVQARARAGGERFCLTCGGTPRSLKKQYQAREVPAWGRDGPLLYTADGLLLFVPGLGVDARRLAPSGEPQLGIRWQAGLPGRRQPGR